MSNQKEKLSKFASACRSLASDLEEGKGPKLRTQRCFENGPACAIGHVLYRAGFDGSNRTLTFNAYAISEFLGDGNPLTYVKDGWLAPISEVRQIQSANDYAKSEDSRSIDVIKPLRNLAAKVDEILAADLPNMRLTD